MASEFSFYRDGLRVEPRWPEVGERLTDTGMNVGGVSPKRIVTDEHGFKWMLKFEGADTDVAASKMANALRLPQPFVKYFNGKYIDRSGRETRGVGSIQEWLDEAVPVGTYQVKSPLSSKHRVQRSLHSLLSYLTGDGDRHDANEVIWYDDVYAIDRSRALGWHGNWFGALSLGSKIMNAATPDLFEAYLDRLDNINDADWLDMAGPASNSSTNKDQILVRKNKIRTDMASNAQVSMDRVFGENRDEWSRFIRLNGWR